jgi:GTP-binding protein
MLVMLCKVRFGHGFARGCTSLSSVVATAGGCPTTSVVRPTQLLVHPPSRKTNINLVHAKLAVLKNTPQTPKHNKNNNSLQPAFEPEGAFFNEVRALRKANAVRKIVLLAKAQGTDLSSDMVLFTLKSLQLCNRTDLFPEVHQLAAPLTMSKNWQQDTTFATAYVKSFCRVLLPQLMNDLVATWTENFTNRVLLEQHAASVTNLAVSFAMIGHCSTALDKIHLLHNHPQHPIAIPVDAQKRLLKLFFQRASAPEIMALTKVLLTPAYHHSLQDADSMQLLVSNFISSMEFLKGAVSLETLPSDISFPEFVFIGRSNVGKSSLINTITNRKHLAYTSKTPGKTSEFNYFLAHGSVGHASTTTTTTASDMHPVVAVDNNAIKTHIHEKSSKQKSIDFCLVDVPGVGYAQKAKSTRSGWFQLMQQYVSQRKELRCVFHLVDSRHGLLDSDRDCLSLLSSMPLDVDYVVVLTKIDKIASSVSKSFVSDALLENLRSEIAIHAGSERNVQIMFSSSQTRLGGPELLMKIVGYC